MVCNNNNILNSIDDKTLFYFILTIPNFINNCYVKERILKFISEYKETLNFNTICNDNML